MKSNQNYSFLKGLLITYLCLTVVLPILRLFGGIRYGHIHAIVTAPQFLPMLKNSLVTTILATVISVTLAFFLAFALCRSNIRFKSLWVVLFTIPMLIPSISHGMGLVFLFGDNGIITNLLGINIGLYGYTGIILGSILYSFPVAFLLFYDSFQYEDFTIYESAQVLGLSKFRQFFAITLPSMKQAIISAILSVFTMVFTDYGVPLMTGGTMMTLPVFMYREVIGMMNFSGGAVVGVILLAPAVIAFILDLRKSNTVSGGSTITKKYVIEENKLRDTLVYIAFSVALFLLCLPIVAFACLSFVKQYPIDMHFTLDHLKKLLSGGIGMYLLNSLAVALMTALVGTCLAYFSAYVTARSEKAPSNQFLHFISMLPLAIPGVVLGLSYVLSFNRLPWYSTIFILIMVNIIHFFSSPYLLAYNSLIKFNPNLEDVADTLGIGKIRMLTAVYIPSTVPTIIEMYSYFFVNSMITISAVSFLVNFRTTTLALMIPQLESQSFIEGTAMVSLMILLLNVAEKVIAFFARRSQLKHDQQLQAVQEITNL